LNLFSSPLKLFWRPTKAQFHDSRFHKRTTVTRFLFGASRLESSKAPETFENL
jgi:hypothetical protein